MLGREAKTAELFLAALLKSERHTAKTCLDSVVDASGFVEEIVFALKWSGLAGLFYLRLNQLELLDELRKFFVADVGDLSGYFERLSAEAVIKATQMEQWFGQLRSILQVQKENILWMKSTTISRSLYEKPYLRVGVDFDLVVRQSSTREILQSLEEQGFKPVLNDPGFCHQSGVGPTHNLDSLFLTPHDELEGCHNLTLSRVGWPYVEIKFNPLETGLKMKETSRLFVDAESFNWQNDTVLTPSLVDHLMIEAVHLNKHRLWGWGWRYDTFLLCQEMARTPALWEIFVRRCELEGVAGNAWASLDMLKRMLDAKVPDEVIAALKPKGDDKINHFLLNNVTPEFIWNCNSLPALLMNAFCVGDSKRKLRVLNESFFPDQDFLSRYYLRGKPVNTWNYMWCLVLHWLVLLLPAGVIRRTFGKSYWPPSAGAFDQ